MKWEYKIEYTDDDLSDDGDRREMEKKRNELGKAGWEAVAVWKESDSSSTYLLFKRDNSK